MTGSWGARIGWVAAGVFGVVAFVVVGLAVRDSPPGVDTWALRSLSAPAWHLGTVGTALVATLVLAVVGVGVTAAVQGRASVPHLLRCGVLLLVGQSMAFLKEVFARPQPGDTTGTEFSYPSGHTGLGLAAAFTLVLLVAELHPRWRTRVAVTTGAVVLGVMVGRVLAGEHYLTDVVGTVLGVLGVLTLTATALGLLPVRSPALPTRSG